MFNIDGLFLIAFSAMILVLVQRDYLHAGMTMRGVLDAVSFLAFGCSMHAFGIMRHQWAAAYWARVALDACLLIAGANRLWGGRFVPQARRGRP